MSDICCGPTNSSSDDILQVESDFTSLQWCVEPSRWFVQPRKFIGNNVSRFAKQHNNSDDNNNNKNSNSNNNYNSSNDDIQCSNADSKILILFSSLLPRREK